MDYVLGTDHHMIHNLAVWDPRHNIDHSIVLGCLCGVILREHQCYIGFCTRLPLYPFKCPSHEYNIFSSISQAVPKTLVRECVHDSWILEET